jgi:hypothetical protein
LKSGAAPEPSPAPPPRNCSPPPLDDPDPPEEPMPPEQFKKFVANLKARMEREKAERSNKPDAEK